MEEYKDEGLSIGEIFKVIYKRLGVVLALTASIMTIGVLAVAIIVNPLITSYSIRFTVDYPGSESMRYPDGTVFRYKEIISRENLEAVSGSDDDFESINAEALYENDAITITEESTPDSSARKYVIMAKSRYFDDVEIATSFIRALAESPVRYVNSAMGAIDYAVYLTSYESADVKTYEEKIDFLADQRDYIVKKYDNLIDVFSEDYTVLGKTLATYQQNAKNAFCEDDEALLRNELDANLYVLGMSKRELESQKTILQKEHDSNSIARIALEEKRSELVAELARQGILSSSENLLAPYNNKIVEYVDRNAQIEQEIADVENKIANLDSESNDKTAFENKMDEYKSALEDATEKYKSVSATVYSGESETVFDSYSVKEEGNLGLPIAFLISLLLGLVASSVIVCAMDLPKYIRDKKQPKTETPET